VKLFPNNQAAAATSLAMMAGVTLSHFFPSDETWATTIQAMIVATLVIVAIWFLVSNCYPDEYYYRKVWLIRRGGFSMVFQSHEAAIEWIEYANLGPPTDYYITEERVYR